MTLSKRRTIAPEEEEGRPTCGVSHAAIYRFLPGGPFPRFARWGQTANINMARALLTRD